MSAPGCPCVYCEIDRERGLPQYRLKLDGDWYDPRIGYPMWARSEALTPLVGPSHPITRHERYEVKP